MKLSLDDDGNFLFDGEICTDDRIDDIREFVCEANKAFEVIRKVKDMINNPSHHSTSFGILYELNKVKLDDGIANCIDNPETTASPIPAGFAFTNYAEGSQLKTFWYDNQGNAHQY